jgi:hypothetical protein
MRTFVIFLSDIIALVIFKNSDISLFGFLFLTDKYPLFFAVKSSLFYLVLTTFLALILGSITSFDMLESYDYLRLRLDVFVKSSLFSMYSFLVSLFTKEL